MRRKRLIRPTGCSFCRPIRRGKRRIRHDALIAWFFYSVAITTQRRVRRWNHRASPYDRRFTFAAEDKLFNQLRNRLYKRSTLLIPPPSTITSGSRISRHVPAILPAAARSDAMPVRYRIAFFNQADNFTAFQRMSLKRR